MQKPVLDYATPPPARKSPVWLYIGPLPNLLLFTVLIDAVPIPFTSWIIRGAWPLVLAVFGSAFWCGCALPIDGELPRVHNLVLLLGFLTCMPLFLVMLLGGVFKLIEALG